MIEPASQGLLNKEELLNSLQTEIASLKQKVLVLQNEKTELLRSQQKSTPEKDDSIKSHNFSSHLESAIQSVVERSNLRKSAEINRKVSDLI